MTLCSPPKPSLLLERNRELSKLFPGVTWLSRKHPRVLEFWPTYWYVDMCQKLWDLWSVMPSSGGAICIQVKPRMCRNRSSKQTQISEEMRGSALVLSLLLSLPWDSTFLWGPGESRFPFSHMNIYKRQHHTENAAGLFVGDFWPLLEFSCPALSQLQKTKGFQGALFVCWSGPTRMVRADPPDITQLEPKHVIMWTDTLMLRVLIFTLSVVTHCLGQPPLKQTTKALCKELTPYQDPSSIQPTIVGCQIDSEKTWNKWYLHCAPDWFHLSCAYTKTQGVALLLCLFTGTLLQCRGCFCLACSYFWQIVLKGKQKCNHTQ